MKAGRWCVKLKTLEITQNIDILQTSEHVHSLDLHYLVVGDVNWWKRWILVLKPVKNELRLHGSTVWSRWRRRSMSRRGRAAPFGPFDPRVSAWFCRPVNLNQLVLVFFSSFVTTVPIMLWVTWAGNELFDFAGGTRIHGFVFFKLCYFNGSEMYREV